jgi:multicomponent Na+:H+ antiporter subunit B
VGVDAARTALKVHPLAYAGFGVALAALAGVLSLLFDVPFLTGLWTIFEFDGVEVAISTPMVFDIGVYFVVFGTIAAVALALEDEEGGA